MGWEIESGVTDVPDHVVVQGRLKEHVSFWKDTIRAPATIADTIESGYVLLLKSELTSYACRNHQAANSSCSFVERSISDLCAMGCVVKVSDMQHICSRALSVVESSSGNKNLVFNLILPLHVARTVLAFRSRTVLESIYITNSLTVPVCAREWS